VEFLVERIISLKIWENLDKFQKIRDNSKPCQIVKKNTHIQEFLSFFFNPKLKKIFQKSFFFLEIERNIVDDVQTEII